MIFGSPRFDRHEKVISLFDASVGLRGFIAIHSTALGPAIGGTRLWAYQSEQEAVDDVLRLSQGMSYKAALAGIPSGGGKAVLWADPEKGKTNDLLKAFAREINALGGVFLTGEDVGIDATDIEVMAEISPYVKGTRQDKSGDPSPMTAFGVLQGMKAALHTLEGHTALKGKRVSLQGLGKVGYALASLVREEGATVIACDINEERVRMAERELGIERVSAQDIYDVKADIFAPCGLGGVLNKETIARLAVDIVAGSANNQLQDPSMGDLLKEKKILYAPDYVINAGGLMNVYAAGESYDASRVRAQVARIYETTLSIFKRSEVFRFATNHVADQTAREILTRKKKEKQRRMRIG